MHRRNILPAFISEKRLICADSNEPENNHQFEEHINRAAWNLIENAELLNLAKIFSPEVMKEVVACVKDYASSLSLMMPVETQKSSVEWKIFKTSAYHTLHLSSYLLRYGRPPFSVCDSSLRAMADSTEESDSVQWAQICTLCWVWFCKNGLSEVLQHSISDVSFVTVSESSSIFELFLDHCCVFCSETVTCYADFSVSELIFEAEKVLYYAYSIFSRVLFMIPCKLSDFIQLLSDQGHYYEIRVGIKVWVGISLKNRHHVPLKMFALYWKEMIEYLDYIRE